LNKKKQKVKQIARERIDVLVECALHEKDDHLAEKQARQDKAALLQKVQGLYSAR
jgi:hypothetical protein